MHAHNFRWEFIGTMRLFAALGCLVVHACANADTLPFLIGKRCGVLSPKSLLFIHDGSSVISWFVGSVKFTARDGINRINGKESSTKAFASCAVACGVHCIGYLFCCFALHP